MIPVAGRMPPVPRPIGRPSRGARRCGEDCKIVPRLPVAVVPIERLGQRHLEAPAPGSPAVNPQMVGGGGDASAVERQMSLRAVAIGVDRVLQEALMAGTAAGPWRRPRSRPAASRVMWPSSRILRAAMTHAGRSRRAHLPEGEAGGLSAAHPKSPCRRRSSIPCPRCRRQPRARHRDWPRSSRRSRPRGRQQPCRRRRDPRRRRCSHSPRMAG